MKKCILPFIFSIPLLMGIFLFSYNALVKEPINVGGRIVVTAVAYGEPDNTEGLAWIRLVEEFEELNPDIDIQYELLYDEAFHNRITERIALGNVPDMSYIGGDARWGAIWKASDQYYDHQNDIDRDLYDINLIPAMGNKGEAYYIPMSISNLCSVFFMNEELVRSLGFSAPRRYEDLVAMVPAAKAAGLDVVSFDGADAWAWGTCIVSMLIGRTSGNHRWVSESLDGLHYFTDQEFLDALEWIRRMVVDGVLPANVLSITNDENIANFNNEKALFMTQGQWVTSQITNPAVREHMVLMNWPDFPKQKGGTHNYGAAAMSVGYGLTRDGAKKTAVKQAALSFIAYFNSTKEVELRLRNGEITGPILKDFVIPNDMPSYVGQKLELSRNTYVSDVIDSFLAGAPNEALNNGIQLIADGKASPLEVAVHVEQLLRGR